MRRHWSTRAYEELGNIVINKGKFTHTYISCYTFLLFFLFIASELSWNAKKISLTLPARRRSLMRVAFLIYNVSIPTQHAKTFDHRVPPSLPRFTKPASKLSYLGKRSEPRENARARGQGKESLQPSLWNFHFHPGNPGTPQSVKTVTANVLPVK